MLTQKPDSMRAMTYLRRLEDEADRRPIIEKLLAGEYTTDMVEARVKEIQQRKTPVGQPAPATRSEQQTPDASEEGWQPVQGGQGENTTPASSPGNQQGAVETTSGDQPRPLPLSAAPPKPAAFHPSEHSGTAPKTPARKLPEEDPRMEQTVKLKAALDRLETYLRVRGQGSLSPKEQEYLKRIADIVKSLLL